MRLSCLTLICTIFLVSCGIEKKANKAFVLGKYQNSIDLYKKVADKSQSSGKANYFIAESYRLSNRPKEAEAFYAKAGGKGIDSDSVQFYYAQSLKANSKYAEARQQLDELIKSSTNTALKDRAKSEMDGLAYLEKLNETESYYKVKNLELINTPSSEYSPVFLNNELYFTSSRGNDKIYEATGTPYTDIFKVASRGAIVDVTTVAALPQGINTSSINDGCITFSPDGKTMVFAKGNTAKRKSADDVDLYISRFRNGVWSEPVMININEPGSWDSTPAFSPDGRTLYFSSNRKSRGRNQISYGGTDIYSAQMDTRGRFSRVRNLGPEVNTAGNELFP